MGNKKLRRAGIAASLSGICCNLLLSFGKITSGLIFGMVSVTADGLNNLSDCGSGIITLLCLHIAGKPADKEHPFGHRRAEYIASMATGFIILLLAFELARESIGAIIYGTSAEASWIVFAVLGVSVAIKGGLFFFYLSKARALGSDSLRAAAIDSACDCASTLAVILGALLTRAGVPADGWVGVIVALLIAWQGIKVLAEAYSKLLGQAPDPEVSRRLGELILACKGALGYHDLRIFSYGNGVTFATVHVEMDALISPVAAHAALDELEQTVFAQTGITLTTHLDPVDLADGEAAMLKELMEKKAEALFPGLKLHDFRLVRGAKTKVIFDVCAPFSCKTDEGKIRQKLSDELSAIGDYIPVITIERG